MIQKVILNGITALLIFMSIPSVLAQNAFQEAFDKTSRSSVENLRMDIVDDQGNKTFLPISIIKGEKEGPVFTMVAGVHGYEYPPIVAVQELLQEINPKELTGTLIVIPIASTNSFYTRTPFKNLNDGVNLNNAFPGKASGTVTQKIAHLITTEIIPVTDVFLDIHGGDASEELLPFICYYNNEQKPAQTKLAQQLSEVSGFEYIVSYPYTLKDDEPAKYAFKQAVQDGKTALSIESGKLGNVQEEAVSLIVKGVFNMLDKMKMYTSTSTVESNLNRVRLNSQAYIPSPNQGVFYSALLAGDTILKGELVGIIKDEFGKLLAEVRAPKTGIILYKIGTPPVSKGETIMCISSFSQ